MNEAAGCPISSSKHLQKEGPKEGNEQEEGRRKRQIFFYLLP